MCSGNECFQLFHQVDLTNKMMLFKLTISIFGTGEALECHEALKVSSVEGCTGYVISENAFPFVFFHIEYVHPKEVQRA